MLIFFGESGSLNCNAESFKERSQVKRIEKSICLVSVWSWTVCQPVLYFCEEGSRDEMHENPYGCSGLFVILQLVYLLVLEY